MPLSNRTAAILFFIAAALWAVLAFTVIDNRMTALLSVLLAAIGAVFLSRKPTER